MWMPSTATASRDVKSTKEPTKSTSFVNYSLDFVATKWLPLFSLQVILALASMLKDSFDKLFLVTTINHKKRSADLNRGLSTNLNAAEKVLSLFKE